MYGIYDDITVIEDALCHHYDLLDTNNRLKNMPIIKYGYEISRTIISEEIYSVDPDGCKDIDDAFSIKEDNNGFHLWIHISDVYSNLMRWYDDASYIVSHLYQGSSIYLRKRIRHMLSNVWSTNICSLLEGTTKNMLTMYIHVDKNNEIDCKFYASYGKITKNYNYDNGTKLCNKYYEIVSNIYQCFMEKYGSNVDNYKISDTHKFIEALMIIYNLYFGNEITSDWTYKILRIQKDNKYDITTGNYDKDLIKFLKIINSTRANYEVTNILDNHASLGVRGYTHVTSPIRRRIDLINQMMYYNKDIIKYEIMLGIISDINMYEKKLKCMNRDLSIIYLLERVYNKPNYETVCYIYDFNIVKNKLSLYFPKERLSVRMQIVMRELIEIYSIIYENNNILIKNKQTNETEKILKIMELLKVRINGIPKINKLDDALLVEFNI